MLVYQLELIGLVVSCLIVHLQVGVYGQIVLELVGVNRSLHLSEEAFYHARDGVAD